MQCHSKEKELHILFNNGGVMNSPIDQLTEDGYDLQFGSNVLGHYYFTTLLLPALLEGAKTSGDGHARVVNTSSSRHLMGQLDFNTFKDGPARRKAGSAKLYSQSKYVSMPIASMYPVAQGEVYRATLYSPSNSHAGTVSKGSFPLLSTLVNSLYFNCA